MMGEWLSTFLGLSAVPLLVLLNAGFVAAEFALVGVRRTRVEELVNARRAGALAVKQALDNLDRMIAATQLGITLSSLGLGWIGEPCLADVIGKGLVFLPTQWTLGIAHTLAIIIAFSLITALHVILGELVPKGIALQRPDAVALWSAQPLLWFARVVLPLTRGLSGAGNFILRRLGIDPPEGHEMLHSVDELGMLVEENRRAGVLHRDQAEYLHNVFRLPEKRVRDCLISRERIGALELHLPEDKILSAVRDGAHTRMPVYDGDLDHIVGIVNTKNLFHLFSVKGMVVLDDAMYPPLFVTPDRPISEVLRLFRRVRRPMAIVQDEQDRTLGVITLEDIVEEIVGEIEDEHDVPRRVR
jgi:CBS domain containing-hemolysin-like protein